MRLKLLPALAALALAAPLLAEAAVTADGLHRAEMERLGIAELRPGASGNAKDANAANSDEARAGGDDVPALFAAPEDGTPVGWTKRRAQLARLIEDNWVGRIPDSVARFRIVWSKSPAKSRAQDPRGTVAEQWAGLVITPDGRSGPVIDATITFPARAAHVPALIDYSYIWPAGFNVAALAAGGPPAPDSVAVALRHGFAHVAYRPQLLQPDSAATMKDGVIGLARWPRAATDWGALRAWAWGASRLREELAKDRRINGERIALVGHSRFGKSVLVAAAFDPEFADADVSSSGAGGAKLMRRDYGERWENMAGSGAFHWFAATIMNYARPGKSVADLPVDAHMLIALRAPRPLFITSGTSQAGDAWVDPAGMWKAAMLAEPAWAIHGAPTPRGAMPAPGTAAQADYPLGWYQHRFGHIPWPGFERFYAHEKHFAAARLNR
ncbi:MAG: hypothetical protein P0Y56_02735 [Candidatus Andeanibacterium colombiense]|uniref:4-O-methyl-glucuronoyl methylesterase-like domain-containing protein n=1 Tax=Candidatus Andeanibacterium colombiense TaxID=3121345 RepID=A0AAJ6BPJ1_9SPHN|nr:MAG: hypothetical protein P0Y56_02735 [Sphingomonadaceae bacterium]